MDCIVLDCIGEIFFFKLLRRLEITWKIKRLQRYQRPAPCSLLGYPAEGAVYWPQKLCANTSLTLMSVQTDNAT